MQKFPGKFDCTRSSPCHRNATAYIFALLTLLVTSCAALAQTVAGPAPASSEVTVAYPEVGWRSRSTYCNPYFGFQLRLPAELKTERIFLPVQSSGRHMLLATRLYRVDRTAELFISAFEDRTDDPARQAARNRQHDAHEKGLPASGPSKLSARDHEIHRVRIADDSQQGLGEESSYFFSLRGYVIHVAMFTHDLDFADTIDAVIQHMEFFEPNVSACHESATTPASPSPANATNTPESSSTAAHPASPSSAPPAKDSNATIPQPQPSSSDLRAKSSTAESPVRLYYGPALPTDMVESTIQRSPGATIPSGKFARGNFSSPALGIRVVLPDGWQSLDNEEAYRVSELMRDPTSDPGLTDRRRSLFRACSRVIFTAHEPGTELIPLVHPMVAIAAMPVGCVPDLEMPGSTEDSTELEDFATLLVRSLGVLQLKRGGIVRTPSGRLIFQLDGTLPYQIPDEKLSRRLTLRVSTTTSGPWLIFVYSVTASPAAQRDLETHIGLTNPDTVAAK